MNLNHIYNFFYGFIIVHPLISIAIGAVMGIIIYFKPKEIIKVTAVFVGILIVVYLLACLTGASKTGYLEKEKGVHKSINEEEE